MSAAPSPSALHALVRAIALAARFNSDARELHAQRSAARSADVSGSTR